MKYSTKLYIIILLSWTLTPLLWQLYTSFCTPDMIIGSLNTTESRWTLDNYRMILNADIPFTKYILNSAIVGLLSTLLTLLISIPAAYALTRLPKNVASYSRATILIAALSPYVLLFLALLEIARNLNIGNSLIYLSIPYSALSMPIALLLLSSTFKEIPQEIEEACKLEGFSTYQTIKHVLVPLIKPTIASTAILVFLFSWNEYPIALTWLSNAESLTLPVAIARLAGSSLYSIPYGAYAAATVLGAIPLILLVLLFQKQIINGLTKGAVKG